METNFKCYMLFFWETKLEEGEKTLTLAKFLRPCFFLCFLAIKDIKNIQIHLKNVHLIFRKRSNELLDKKTIILPIFNIR